VSLTTVQAILTAFIDVTEKHMTPEGHEALVRECYGVVREELGV
jgi:hypothetical protein